MLYTSSGIQDWRAGVSNGGEGDTDNAAMNNESINFSLVFTYEFEGCEVVLWTESELEQYPGLAGVHGWAGVCWWRIIRGLFWASGGWAGGGNGCDWLDLFFSSLF